VYFVSQAKAQGQAASRGFSVSVLEGMGSNEISTPDVERVLNADGLVNAWGAVVSLFGHDIYIISMPATSQTLAYDIKSKNWFFMNKQTARTAVSVTALTCTAQVDGTGVVTATAAGWGGADGDPITIAGATPAGYNGTYNVTYVSATQFTYVVSATLGTSSGTITATGYTASYFPLRSAFQSGSIQVFQDDTTGILYQFSDTTYTDLGAYIDAKVRNKLFDNGTDQAKFLPWIDVITDRASSNVLYRHTDDDYQNYIKYRIGSLSGTRTRFNRTGRFIRRATIGSGSGSSAS